MRSAFGVSATAGPAVVAHNTFIVFILVFSVCCCCAHFG